MRPAGSIATCGPDRYHTQYDHHRTGSVEKNDLTAGIRRFNAERALGAL